MNGIFRHRYAPVLAGSLAVAALAAFLTLYRSAPGELSAPHAAAAGSPFIGDCRKCHTPAGMPSGCLSCHTEIAAQLDGGSGYHGKTLGDKARNCGPCHPEHNGKEFALVNRTSWGGTEPKTFAHSHTGFTLKDTHAKLACAACHVKHAPPFSLPQFPSVRRSATFLGLKQDCVSCHANPHASGPGRDCARCHTQDKFKPALNFDHDKFFPLRDAHAKVACAECHKHRDAPQAADKLFGAVEGTSCRDCHATPHGTDWRADCRTCHTGRAVPWTEARARLTRAAHASTGFRLDGPHARVSCRKCHDPARPYAERHSAGGRARARKDCAACHKDPHAGQFPRRACLNCHGETAFKPSTYTAGRHADVYPLNGGHAGAACADCHIYEKVLKAVRYAGTRRDCAFCHKDPHAGQFRSDGRTKCENCHRDTSAWERTVFDHETMSRFKPGAAHAKVACQECHPPALTPDGRKVTLYKPLKRACEDCHAAH